MAGRVGCRESKVRARDDAWRHRSRWCDLYKSCCQRASKSLPLTVRIHQSSIQAPQLSEHFLVQFELVYDRIVFPVACTRVVVHSRRSTFIQQGRGQLYPMRDIANYSDICYRNISVVYASSQLLPLENQVVFPTTSILLRVSTSTRTSNRRTSSSDGASMYRA